MAASSKNPSDQSSTVSSAEWTGDVHDLHEKITNLSISQEIQEKNRVKWENDAKKKINEFTEKTKQQLENFQTETVKELKRRLQEENSRDINELKTKVVELLAVFVALFTFVSLDFSLLKAGVHIWVSAALILIAGGLLLSFLLVMHYILRDKDANKEKPFTIWILALVLISFGILMLFTNGTATPIPLDDQNIDINVNNNFKNRN